jgi:hypothetical protein
MPKGEQTAMKTPIKAIPIWTVTILSMVVLATAGSTAAQTTVGGHIGFVLPLITRAGGQTTNLGDGFSVGFPMGITVKGIGRMAFDLELVPSVKNTPRAVALTVHPGLVWGVDTALLSVGAPRSMSTRHSSDSRRS